MKLTLALLSISISLVGYSQLEGISQTARYHTPFHAPSNTDRYGVDYELKDYTFVDGDSSVLELLDLDAIDHLRAEDHAVEVPDANLGVIVVLFHEKRGTIIVNSLLLND